MFYLVSLSNGTVLMSKYLGGQVRAIQFSPDDKYIYAGTDPFLFKLSTNTGKVIWGADIWSWPLMLAFSPDGSKVASTVKTGDITVVNTTTGNVLWSSHDGGIGQWVAFSPDGSKVAGANFGGTMVYNSTTGKLLWRAGTSKDGVFSSNGKYIFPSQGTMYTSEGEPLEPSLITTRQGTPFEQLYQFVYINQNNTRIVATVAGNGGNQNTGILFFSGNITEMEPFRGGNNPLPPCTQNCVVGNKTSVNPPQPTNGTFPTSLPINPPSPNSTIPQQSTQSTIPVNQSTQSGSSSGNILSNLLNAIIHFFSNL